MTEKGAEKVLPEDDSSKLLNFGEAVMDKEFVYELRNRLWGDLLQRPTNRLQFPGSQPISFARHHLDLLKREDYYVCEKSDGVRYLLYYAAPYGKRTAFLIDRQFECQELEGSSTPARIEGTFQEDTLLDGELICEGEDEKFTFLIFDALLINGRNIMNLSLPERLKYIQNDIILPMERETLNGNVANTKTFFKVQMKKMWKPYAVAEILELEIPKQLHGNDGLIFTPVHDPYVAGTCTRLLKWKPAELNSVDFLLVIKTGHDDEKVYELHVATNRDEHSFFALHQPDSKLDEFDGQVIECNYKVDQSSSTASGKEKDSVKWQFIRPRRDKKNANYERVVDKIIESIKDNVTSKELIAAIPEIKRAWKAREATVNSAPLNTKRPKL